MPPPRELVLLRVPMLWLDDERLGEKLRLGIVVARVLLSRTLLRPIELLRLLPIELLRLVP